MIKIKLLSEGAKVPTQATENAAGFDLYTPENTIINPGRNIIKLDFAMQMPPIMEAQIRPRSGFSAKGFEGYDMINGNTINENDKPKRFDADVMLGTIDSDYRGCVGVLVYSREKEPFVVKKHTRIAQAVFSSFFTFPFSICSELSDTNRADGGFGHTGTR